MKDAIITWLAKVAFGGYYFLEENYLFLMRKEDKKDKIRIEKNAVY
ncbi:MAG: hypothetical protein WA055_01575 [Candidatus Moraniibacteriota bacterium]